MRRADPKQEFKLAAKKLQEYMDTVASAPADAGTTGGSYAGGYGGDSGGGFMPQNDPYSMY